MQWKTEAEARESIKNMVTDYYRQFKENKKDFVPGDRIAYASRVYDEKEMCALTDAMLDFWLTTGRFAEQFEKEFSAWLGVRWAHLVNSGSSANLLAFMVLTAGMKSLRWPAGSRRPWLRYCSMVRSLCFSM